MKRILKALLDHHTYKVLFWIWLALIVILSSYPDLSPDEEKTKRLFSIRLDYLAHIIMYLILSMLVILWKSGLERIRFKTGIIYTLLLIAFSYVEELHQSIIPGRSYNIVDFIYNSLGVILGYFTALLLIKYRTFENIFNRFGKGH
ncbi:MAG: VanZ family protein [Bacteroidales bacterium]|nr:VanZ family protein [Bacteroidales bacterium]